MVNLRMSAYIAPYLDAIKAARAAGWRWSDCRDALGIDCRDATFAQAVRRCKWQAEQLPLPAVSGGTKTVAVGSGNSAKNAERPEPEQEPEKHKQPRRPLPDQIPFDDGDEMKKALEKKGIVFE